MEKNEIPSKNRFIFSQSPVQPLPSPIPTARGTRSAADPTLSSHIDASVQIPDLKLPQHAHRFRPEEIDFRRLASGENDSVRRLLGSFGEFGVVQIKNHGISTEEVRFALGIGERMFGLAAVCCSSYGDHERIIWRGDDRRIAEEATTAIGERNYQMLCKEMEKVARQLQEIAQKVVMVSKEQIQEPIQLGESILSIYRYHRSANIINRTSPAIEETSPGHSPPYALVLHLFLAPAQLFLGPGSGNSSFQTNTDTIVVAIGKEIEETSFGEFKLVHVPFLLTNGPSFSIEQKWSISNTKKSSKIISLGDQILILLIIAILYKWFA